MSKYKVFTDSELVVFFHRFDLSSRSLTDNVDNFLGFNPRFPSLGEEKQRDDWFGKALALDKKEEYSIFEEVSEELRGRGIDPFLLK